jgi:hypothetical protein
LPICTGLTDDNGFNAANRPITQKPGHVGKIANMARFNQIVGSPGWAFLAAGTKKPATLPWCCIGSLRSPANRPVPDTGNIVASTIIVISNGSSELRITDYQLALSDPLP